MAQTLEKSDHTSIQRRIETIKGEDFSKSRSNNKAIKSSSSGTERANTKRDEFLSPVEINERTDRLGTHLSRTGKRASDKGFLPISTNAYIELLDWTARQVKRGKAGSTPANALPILDRLGINGKTWCEIVTDFGKLFCAMAGKPHEIDARRSRNGMRRYRTKSRIRELLCG